MIDPACFTIFQAPPSQKYGGRENRIKVVNVETG